MKNKIKSTLRKIAFLLFLFGAWVTATIVGAIYIIVHH